MLAFGTARAKRRKVAPLTALCRGFLLDPSSMQMHIFLDNGSDRSIGGGYEACDERQNKVVMLRSHVSVSE